MKRSWKGRQKQAVSVEHRGSSPRTASIYATRHYRDDRCRRQKQCVLLHSSPPRDTVGVSLSHSDRHCCDRLRTTAEWRPQAIPGQVPVFGANANRSPNQSPSQTWSLGQSRRPSQLRMVGGGASTLHSPAICPRRVFNKRTRSTTRDLLVPMWRKPHKYYLQSSQLSQNPRLPSTSPAGQRVGPCCFTVPTPPAPTP